MPDYKQGRIYCLRSHQTDDIYIGSTTQPLSKRMVEHRSRYKKWKNGEINDYRSASCLTKYDDCYIELIEECSCDNKNQLEKREGQLIREMDCVNKRVAGRSYKEWYEDNKEKIAEQGKKYREQNKEQIKGRNKKYYKEHKEQIKKYRQEHKEQIAEYDKKYKQEHKEQIAEYGKKYKQEHKEQIKKYYQNHKNDFKCDLCNYSGDKRNYNQHLKTQKHIKNSSK